MKTNKKYWLVLLLPITAIVIIAVFLIPGKEQMLEEKGWSHWTSSNE